MKITVNGHYCEIGLKESVNLKNGMLFPGRMIWKSDFLEIRIRIIYWFAMKNVYFLSSLSVLIQ